MEIIRQYIEDKIAHWLESNSKAATKIQFEFPKIANHGDLTTNFAMTMAGEFRMAPRDIAAQIVRDIDWDKSRVEKIEIAGPGFINFFLSTSEICTMLAPILKNGKNYGKNQVGIGQSALVEFVSANPTGPLTIGHGRQAVLGDTVARLLEWSGYDVEREYYFNDAGRQMRILADSVRLRYLELLGESIELNEDHYQGEYIIDIANNIRSEKGDALRATDDLTEFKQKAEDIIFADIKKTLVRLGIHFDRYFNEKGLYDDGKIEEILESLSAKGLTYDDDGALWFKTTALGFDQDRVIKKSSGEPTYRLPDMAYHQDKYRRGYDKIIDLFGSDHIDTYPDVLAAMKALGWDTDKIKVLIHQFVTLYEGEKVVKMSTRKANFVTLDELIDEVGEDVTRYFFVMRHFNSHLNFDLKLAKTESEENPVYYTQYAHARICSIFRKAEEENIHIDTGADLTLLIDLSELALIKHLAQFPQVIREAAIQFEPHRITNYLNDTSTLFHRFYHNCRVIGEEEKLMSSRFQLLEATRQVIFNGLTIIGVSAPDKM